MYQTKITLVPAVIDILHPCMLWVSLEIVLTEHNFSQMNNKRNFDYIYATLVSTIPLNIKQCLPWHCPCFSFWNCFETGFKYYSGISYSANVYPRTICVLLFKTVSKLASSITLE